VSVSVSIVAVARVSHWVDEFMSIRIWPIAKNLVYNWGGFVINQ
jgi:hypothetical protein